MSDTCGYTTIDADGIEQPCGWTATGWRWYGEGHDHEPMLVPACALHSNRDLLNPPTEGES